ncbi:hypothetical protein GCM10023346_10780 [Arthrobacter gyeryongensis]|uniref:Uncharacterized protein n=1 Tax=Arthrobacter gyeryongensis TaxID=1650592 RepID=A0ABP9S613_9MICC
MESMTLSCPTIKVSRETATFATELVRISADSKDADGAAMARADPKEINGGIRWVEVSLLPTVTLSLSFGSSCRSLA